MIKYLLSVALLCVSVTLAAHDPSFCNLTATDTSQGKFPPLPSQFSAILEIIEDATEVINIGRVKRNEKGGRIELRAGAGSTDLAIYVQESDQFILVETDRDPFDPYSCQVVESPKTSKNDAVFELWKLMTFLGDLPKEFKESTYDRGFVADMLTSCFYRQDTDSSWDVTWFIANNNTVKGVSASDSTPLGIVIRKKDNKNPNDTIVTEQINIFDYETTLDYKEDILLIPEGYLCKNVTNTRALRTLPRTFSFKAEVEMPGVKPTFVYEEYDFKVGLSRMDFYPVFPFEDFKKYGDGLITKVHDFKMGVEFIRNNRLNTCVYQPINASSADVRNNSAIWRMATPEEFFHLESNLSYQYSGDATVRDILTEVFLVERTAYVETETAQVPIAGRFTWYFTDSQKSDAKTFGAPLKMSFRTELTNYDLNIFDFNEEQPSMVDYSVNDCFTDLDSVSYQLKVDTTKENIENIIGQLDIFKNYVEITTAAYSQVSFLRVRVGDVVKKSDTQVEVQFTIYDKPKDVATKEVSLSDAKKNFQSNVDTSGGFVIFIPNKDRSPIMQEIKVSKSGLEEKKDPSGGSTTSSTGIQPGLLAFLLILMLISGLILGMGAIYLVYLRRGYLPGGASNDGVSVSMNALK